MTASAIATVRATLVNKFFFVKMPAARSAMPRLAIEFYIVDKVDGSHGNLGFKIYDVRLKIYDVRFKI
jgi:hypothetical protein